VSAERGENYRISARTSANTAPARQCTSAHGGARWRTAARGGAQWRAAVHGGHSGARLKARVEVQTIVIHCKQGIVAVHRGGVHEGGIHRMGQEVRKYLEQYSCSWDCQPLCSEGTPRSGKLQSWYA
jgi:hypothetical protein